MPEFALSWNRSRWWAEKLGKPPGRAVSEYHSRKYDDVDKAANHINALCPEMACRVEIFT